MTPPPACSGPFSMPGLCRPRAIQRYDDDVDSKDRGATLTAGINRRRGGLAAHPRTRRPKHPRRGFSGVRLVCALRALWQDGRRQRRRLCALAEQETDQIRAGVAQLAERQPSKLHVAGSIPVSRSNLTPRAPPPPRRRVLPEVAAGGARAAAPLRAAPGRAEAEVRRSPGSNRHPWPRPPRARC